MAENDTDLDDLLTDEEREALKEDDGTDEDAGTPDVPQQDEATASNDDDAATGEDTAAAAAGEDTTQQQAPAPSAAPLPNLDELDAKLAEFKDQRKAALDAYDDGDLDSEELQAKLDEIDTAKDAIVGQRAQAQALAEQDDRNWQQAVSAHFKEYPTLKENQAMMRAFDNQVAAVTGSPLYANLPFDQQLRIAHSQAAASAEAIGLTGFPAIRQAGAPTTPTPKPQSAEGLGQEVPTLARTPVSDQTGEADDPYSDLTKLIESGEDPEKAERILAAMSEEDRDRFASQMY